MKRHYLNGERESRVEDLAYPLQQNKFQMYLSVKTKP